MKQFAAWFTHGVPNGAPLRKSIFEARSGPAVLAAVESFFSGEPADDQAETSDAAIRDDHTLVPSLAADE